MTKTDESFIETLLYAANRYLARRPRSRHEIKEYLGRRLYKKIIPDDKKTYLIDKVVKELEDQELINDESFATWWIEDRSYFKPRGKRALIFELRAKGVAKEVIEAVLDKLDLSEVELAKAILNKKRLVFERLDKNLRQEQIRKLLSRRGFTYEAIKKAIEEIDIME